MLPHVDDFLLNLQANKYSPRTVYNYERDLNVFSGFLDESGVVFDNLDKRAITYYKAYLVSRDRKTPGSGRQGERQLDSRSVNRMLSALRAYLRYLIDIDHHCPLAPEAVKLTKAGKRHPQVAELEELTRLVEAPSTLEPNVRTALRNRAMLEVLFATGMRISELCGLNRSQIDDSGRIFITGKGRKQRFVYLTMRARQHLDAYMATRDDNCPALFIPYAGRNVAKPARRISANYLQDRIKRYREKLRINVPTSAHSLRHGFATYLAEQGANPAALQILLGHESLDTTTRYVHASDKYAEETHRKYHPLGKPT
ncbi:MAG: tyrosine-type recombinase/integrase [Dehalococcoidia bacterium]|nr:tyrosine-type recombinase/integrase [Dehalococcoidia bacterium]